MNKIGFKFSWEKSKRKTHKPKVEEEMIIPGTGIAHALEINMKIEVMETFMTTAGFSRMPKKQKTQYIQAYRFLITTLALIQPQTNSGINEHSDLNSIGYTSEG